MVARARPMKAGRSAVMKSDARGAASGRPRGRAPARVRSPGGILRRRGGAPSASPMKGARSASSAAPAKANAQRPRAAPGEAKEKRLKAAPGKPARPPSAASRHHASGVRATAPMKSTRSATAAPALTTRSATAAPGRRREAGDAAPRLADQHTRGHDPVAAP